MQNVGLFLALKYGRCANENERGAASGVMPSPFFRRFIFVLALRSAGMVISRLTGLQRLLMQPYKSFLMATYNYFHSYFVRPLFFFSYFFFVLFFAMAHVI